MTEQITFSFGENWLNYLDTLTQARFQEARQSLANLLGMDDLTNRTFLDIGCGSGLFSASALSMHAKSVTSIDVDPKSVEATQKLKTQRGAADDWRILHGSILDPQFVAQLPKSDIVYSWGVLHHTGSMWQAIENAAGLVNPNGLFVIAIYNRVWTSGFWLKFKQQYNRSGKLGKQLLVWYLYAPRVVVRALKGKSPFKSHRGMSVYYDAVDWAGGLPYEYASFDEIVAFCAARGFVLKNSIRTNSTGCNQFTFQRQG